MKIDINKNFYFFFHTPWAAILLSILETIPLEELLRVLVLESYYSIIGQLLQTEL